MASSSSSSYAPTWTYDVFLSFRGEDTRTNFIDHLYRALTDRGIITFKDDKNLRKSKSVAPELLKAIEQSRFAIVVFSKNYDDSTWCLDELVKIVECQNSTGQSILPVFYDVKPSEVRKQTGCFEDAFSKHELNDDKDEKQIQRWRDALKQVANISGWDLPFTANGHESQCIEEIVRYVLTDLSNSTSSKLTSKFIGMELRMQKVKSLLSKDPDEVQFIGIVGMGGIGKTTLARAVFEDISNQFEDKCFVENVRGTSKSSGLQCLQERILSQILLVKDLKLPNIHEGLKMMNRCSHKKVLLVLDDVDHLNQLDALAGERNWFGKGSCIIITTRDAHLLVAHGVDKIHKTHFLSSYESHLLFNRHAFKSTKPLADYVDLTEIVIKKAGKLPLALKILGSHLYGRTAAEWEPCHLSFCSGPSKLTFNISKISLYGSRLSLLTNDTGTEVIEGVTLYNTKKKI